MKSFKRVLLPSFVVLSIMILAAAPARAACELDGFNHPSVATIFGQDTDPGTCNGQIISLCNAILVSPTVAITSADCANTWATGDGGVFNLTATWLNHNPGTRADCTGADRISSYHVHPLWDGSTTSPYNIGVIVLDASSAQAPATLPAAGDVSLLLRNDPLDVVAYVPGATGLDPTTRQVAARSFARATDFYLKVKGNACADEPDGSGVFLPSSQDVLGMSISSKQGNLRLDIPEVRSFLSAYVTLP